MNAELKTKWVEALRSGKYAQARRTLRKPDSNEFCCLGVFCEVQGMEWDKDKSGFYVFSQSTMPPPIVSAGLLAPIAQQLAQMNDGGKTFAEIADYIEANL